MKALLTLTQRGGSAGTQHFPAYVYGAGGEECGGVSRSGGGVSRSGGGVERVSTYSQGAISEEVADKILAKERRALESG
jgi:hypothetical protein